MRYAVLFSQHIPEFADAPVQWPVVRRVLDENEQASSPEVEMTGVAFDAFVTSHEQERITFVEWNESRNAAQNAIEVARNEKFAALEEALRTDLFAVFTSWTPAEQYEFDGPRRALADDLAAGNLAKVIDAVTNYRAGDSSLDAVRASLLAVLYPAAAKFAALAGAGTIEQINAI